MLPLPGPHGHYKRGYGLVLFLNSRGEVTAYHPYGERAWQVQTLVLLPYTSRKLARQSSLLLQIVSSHNQDLMICAAQGKTC